MIEDHEWMEAFMKKKRGLMLERYKTTTEFLSKHEIPYFDMSVPPLLINSLCPRCASKPMTSRNAGLFIWVDLRQFLAGSEPPQQSALNSSQENIPDGLISMEGELEFADICIENGVMLAPGHVYMSEEYGWFRITFTVGEEALEEGLNRILASLKKMQAVNQWKRRSCSLIRVFGSGPLPRSKSCRAPVGILPERVSVWSIGSKMDIVVRITFINRFIDSDLETGPALQPRECPLHLQVNFKTGKPGDYLLSLFSYARRGRQNE